MEKKIIKRNTFKEAFADVLKLSHEELIQHSIDPFIREAFHSFEEMDFSYKSINYEFSLSSWFNVFSSYKIITHHLEDFLPIKTILLQDIILNRNYIVANFHMNEYRSYYVDPNSYKIEHDTTENLANEGNEVPQWLHAA